MARLPTKGSIRLIEVPPITCGDAVHFDYIVEGALKNPRISVSAYQNEDLVYAEAGHAYDVFQLGGGSSKWLDNGGGAAHCVADLFYFKVKGTDREWSGHGQQEYVSLAKTTFDAT